MAVSHAAGRGGLAGIGARTVPWRQLAIGIVNVSIASPRPPPEPDPKRRLFVLGQTASKELCLLTSCLKRYTGCIERYCVFKWVEAVCLIYVYNNAYITLYNDTNGV
jgi:hypothetical protein